MRPKLVVFQERRGFSIQASPPFSKISATRLNRATTLDPIIGTNVASARRGRRRDKLALADLKVQRRRDVLGEALSQFVDSVAKTY